MSAGILTRHRARRVRDKSRAFTPERLSNGSQPLSTKWLVHIFLIKCLKSWGLRLWPCIFFRFVSTGDVRMTRSVSSILFQASNTNRRISILCPCVCQQLQLQAAPKSITIINGTIATHNDMNLVLMIPSVIVDKQCKYCHFSYLSWLVTRLCSFMFIIIIGLLETGKQSKYRC